MEATKSIEFVLDYMNTKNARILWAERLNPELLINEADRRLKLFNYFVSKLDDVNDEKINKVQSIINSALVSLIRVERGIVSEFDGIRDQIKDSGISLNKVDRNEALNQVIPKIEMNNEKYNEMFEMARKIYDKGYLYKVRRLEYGTKFAEEGMIKHLNISGEVLTQLFAKEYIQEFIDKKTNEIPENFKLTVSGQDYLEKLNNKNNTKTDKNFIKDLRTIFFPGKNKNQLKK